MLSHIERPILADQIRRVAQQRRHPDNQSQLLNAAYMTLAETRRTERLDCETRSALTEIFLQIGPEESPR
jgi:hypothetical protein